MPSYDLRCEITECLDYQVLQQQWRQLLDFSDASVFLSAEWLSSWLSLIDEVQPPELISIFDGQQLVALGLLHQTTLRRRGVFQRRVLYLNELPIAGNHMVIEYNGLLAKRGDEDRAWQALLGALAKHPGWDEIHLNCLAPSTCQILSPPLLASLGFDHIVAESETIHFSHLPVDQPWLQVERSVLSKNRRAQLRRSIKAYELLADSQLHCVAAGSSKQAIEFFQQMGVLHTQYWQSKGKPGSFANPRWVRFHQSLIRDGFDSGTVQLLSIRAGDTVVGYAYNLCWRGMVYNIQSGLSYLADKKFQPGYVCHYMAMRFNHQLGASEYNLLAGEAGYKKILSNRQEQVEWLVLRLKKARLRFFLEDSLVYLVRKLRALT